MNNDTIKAPFTDEQVKALNEYQHLGFIHEFTCCGTHCKRSEREDGGVLIATKEGWIIFISDNPAFDWQFINFYFLNFGHKNPFGFSARRIGDLYCGMKKDASLNSEWKRFLRQTRHTHNPVDDAKGNAEALLAMQKMGLKIDLK